MLQLVSKKKKVTEGLQ